jgi:hypothetical protein
VIIKPKEGDGIDARFHQIEMQNNDKNINKGNMEIHRIY